MKKKGTATLERPVPAPKPMVTAIEAVPDVQSYESAIEDLIGLALRESGKRRENRRDAMSGSARGRGRAAAGQASAAERGVGVTYHIRSPPRPTTGPLKSRPALSPPLGPGGGQCRTGPVPKPHRAGATSHDTFRSFGFHIRKNAPWFGIVCLSKTLANRAAKPDGGGCHGSYAGGASPG